MFERKILDLEKKLKDKKNLVCTPQNCGYQPKHIKYISNLQTKMRRIKSKVNVQC